MAGARRSPLAAAIAAVFLLTTEGGGRSHGKLWNRAGRLSLTERMVRLRRRAAAVALLSAVGAWFDIIGVDWGAEAVLLAGRAECEEINLMKAVSGVS